MYRLGEVIFVAVVICILSSIFGIGALLTTIVFALIGIFIWCSSHK